jgi:ABC-type branched-subunit amino acid transport system substrate-binding protein
MPAGRPILLLAICIATGSALRAQTDSPGTKPYATLDRQGVTYRGPVAAADKQISDGTAAIGMILPLRGVHEAEGKALLAAAQIALEEEQALGALVDDRRLALAVRDESGPWGQASSEILRLIEQDHVLAVITSANGATAHQAEQIANKISFPILTLASDPTTTETNIPWLFRLAPSDTDQAQAIVRQISERPGPRGILLIVQMDHDGRVGSAEFEKAAKQRKLAAPGRLELSAITPQIDSVPEAIRSSAADTVVLWTDVFLAEQVAPLIRQEAPLAQVYLCSKAAQLSGTNAAGNVSARDSTPSGESFTVAPSLGVENGAQERFAEKYRRRTGNAPGIAVFEAYEAMHLIAAGIRANGANRARLREYFADTNKMHGAAGVVTFDPAGNSTREFAVFKVATAETPAVRP